MLYHALLLIKYYAVTIILKPIPTPDKHDHFLNGIASMIFIFLAN